MSFYDHYTAVADGDLIHQVESVTDGDVQRVLGKHTISPEEFLCLLSPAAETHLEQMARQSHDLTVAQFGRTMVLYTPLYLSNFCTNSCLYCGFNRDNRIVRRQLTLAELEVEARAVVTNDDHEVVPLLGDRDPDRCTGSPVLGRVLDRLDTHEVQGQLRALVDLLGGRVVADQFQFRSQNAFFSLIELAIGTTLSASTNYSLEESRAHYPACYPS